MTVLLLALLLQGGAMIEIPFAPADALIDPSTGHLWLLDNHENAVVAIDPESGATVARVDLDFEPTWIVRCGGRAIAVGVPASAVASVDLASGKVLGTELLRHPDPDGVIGAPFRDPTRILIRYERRVVELDPESLRVLRTFDLPKAEYGDSYRITHIVADGTRCVLGGSSGGFQVFALEEPPRMLVRRSTPAVDSRHEIDPWGQFYFTPVGETSGKTGGVFSLQTGERVSEAQLPVVAFHPDLPYGVSRTRDTYPGRSVLFSTFDRAVEGEALPSNNGEGHNYYTWNAVMIDGARGRMIEMRTDRHVGDKQFGQCGVDRRKPSQMIVDKLPLESLKHKGPSRGFTMTPPSTAEVGVELTVHASVDGATVEAIDPPAGATWDATASVLRWTPGIEAMGKSVSFAFKATAAGSVLTQDVKITVGVALIPDSAGLTYEQTGDGRRLVGLHRETATVCVVDLVERTCRSAKVDLADIRSERASIQQAFSVAEVDGMLLIATGGDRIHRLDLGSFEFIDPIKSKYSNPYQFVAEPDGKGVWVVFYDDKAKNPLCRMTSKGDLTVVKEPENLWVAAAAPGGKQIINFGTSGKATAYRVSGSKATVDTEVDVAESYVFFPAGPKGMPRVEYSADGKRVRILSKIYARDLKKALVEEDGGVLLLDPTDDRYVRYRDGTFGLHKTGSDAPTTSFELKDFKLPGEPSRTITQAFFSGPARAMVFCTPDGVAVIPFP